MRWFLRPWLAGLMIVALGASALASSQCQALHLVSAPVAASHEHQAIDHAAHMADDQHHHGMSHDHGMSHATDDAAPPSSSDHGCLKCCSLCNISSALLVIPTAEPFDGVSSILAALRSPARHGASVLVDPGIPKRIA